MNNAQFHTSEERADRIARNITARLHDGSESLPYDISERLRAARMQALAKRKIAAFEVRTAPVLVSSNGSVTLGMGGEGSGWWNALVSAVPLMALVVGLVFITISQDELGANEVAEVDAALLTDDLPPSAYADPGFMQFLKTSAADPR